MNRQGHNEGQKCKTGHVKRRVMEAGGMGKVKNLRSAC
jgi:hypothetical protein